MHLKSIINIPYNIFLEFIGSVLVNNHETKAGIDIKVPSKVEKKKEIELVVFTIFIVNFGFFASFVFITLFLLKKVEKILLISKKLLGIML
jgi:hypothetical protein